MVKKRSGFASPAQTKSGFVRERRCQVVESWAGTGKLGDTAAGGGIWQKPRVGHARERHTAAGGGIWQKPQVEARPRSAAPVGAESSMIGPQAGQCRSEADR
jgi:hypothetical protein